MKIYFFTLLFWVVSSSPSLARDRRFVGAEACKPCHEKAYEIWAGSGHAMAQMHLSDDKKGELRCLFCHATDAAANLKDFRLSNVQCEACHGAGEKHVQLASQKGTSNEKPGGLEPANEKRCQDCHANIRSPMLRPFDFAKARETIKHW